MTTAKRIVLALSLAFVLTGQASEVPSGAALYIRCKEDLPVCYEYLLGVWDGYSLGARDDICYSAPTMNSAQLRLIFMRFAEANPNTLSMPRASVALISYMLAFPCK